MSIYAPITHEREWFRSEDKTFDFFATTGRPVIVRETAAAGAVTLLVEPLEEALAGSAVVVFVQRRTDLPPRFVPVTVGGGGASAGATSLTVSALVAELRQGTVGRKTLNMAGHTLAWTLDESPASDAVTVLTKVPAITNGFGTNDKATVTVTDDDTLALAAGKYYHELRRTDAGQARVLAYGEAVLRETRL